MKKFLFISLLLIISVTVSSQVVPGAIVHAFENGDAKKMLPYLNDNIEIIIPDNKHNASKNQAVRILEDFFSKYPPLSFSVDSEGSKKDTKYGIGTLHTEKNNFRVNMYFLEGKKEKIIYYLSIEKI